MRNCKMNGCLNITEENFCDACEKALQENTTKNVVRMVLLEVAENGEPINSEGGPILMNQEGKPCAYKKEDQAGKLFRCPSCGSYRLNQNALFMGIDIFCEHGACREKLEVAI